MLWKQILYNIFSSAKKSVTLQLEERSSCALFVTESVSTGDWTPPVSPQRSVSGSPATCLFSSYWKLFWYWPVPVYSVAVFPFVWQRGNSLFCHFHGHMGWVHLISSMSSSKEILAKLLRDPGSGKKRNNDFALISCLRCRSDKRVKII